MKCTRLKEFTLRLDLVNGNLPQSASSETHKELPLFLTSDGPNISPDSFRTRHLLAHAKLTMPVLSIAGEGARAAILGPQMKLVVNDVTVIQLKNTGRWLIEERPTETMDALIAFL